MRVHKSTATMKSTIHGRQHKLNTYFNCPHSCRGLLSFATFIKGDCCFPSCSCSSCNRFYHHGIMTVTTGSRIDRCCGRNWGRHGCHCRWGWRHQGSKRSLVVVVHPCLKFFTRVASIDGIIISTSENVTCLWRWWWRWWRRWRGRRMWLYPNNERERANIRHSCEFSKLLLHILEPLFRNESHLQILKRTTELTAEFNVILEND